MNDYQELNLYFEDMEEGETLDLWVYTEPTKFFIIRGVNNNPVRYKGWWSIPFIQYNRYATAHIEAEKVLFFTTAGEERDNGQNY